MWNCSFLKGALGWVMWCQCSQSRGCPGEQWVEGTGEDQPLPQWEARSNPKLLLAWDPLHQTSLQSYFFCRSIIRLSKNMDIQNMCSKQWYHSHCNLKTLGISPCIMISPVAVSLPGYKGNTGAAAGSSAGCSLFQSLWTFCILVTFTPLLTREFLKLSHNEVLHRFSIMSLNNIHLPLWKKIAPFGINVFFLQILRLMVACFRI